MSLELGWVGFHEEGIYAFENLLNEGINIRLFISLNEISLSKKSASTKKYKVLCQLHNIPFYEIKNINDDEVYDLLKSYSLDILIVIGWSQILSQRILEVTKFGAIGSHASLLPHNRGSAPVNWSIIKGERITGNTLMWLDHGVDTGKIIDQIPIPITNFDTCSTIYTEVSKTNYVMIRKFLSKFEVKKELLGVSQIGNNEENLPRRKPSDGLINWSKSNQEIYNFIRAITKPYPGAYSYMDNKKWIIWKVALLPNRDNNNPGIIEGIVVSPNEEACGLMVTCSLGAIIILEMENEEGDIISGYDFASLNWKGRMWLNE